MIRVFDAFSGIGGFRSAFERVGGFKMVGWCEIDRFAQKSYRALFDTGGEQFYLQWLDCQRKIVQKLFSQRESLKLNRS